MPVYGLQEETWSGDFQEWHQNSLWGLKGEDWFGPGSVMMNLFHFNSVFAFKKHFDFLLKGKMNDVNCYYYFFSLDLLLCFCHRATNNHSWLKKSNSSLQRVLKKDSKNLQVVLNEKVKRKTFVEKKKITNTNSK